MKRYTFLILFLVIDLYDLHAQQASSPYLALVAKADALYEAKDYKGSALKYSEAFASNKGMGRVDDRYNAACSWALAGEADSAFANLDRIVHNGKYANYEHVIKDTDLKSLHADKRWKKLVEKVKLNQAAAEAGYNKPLMTELNQIFNDDQSYRLKLDSVSKQYGRESKEVKDLWKTISYKDSIDLVKVKGILDQHGWLGANEVGDRGNLALFLVIQHADIATQVKYLPMVREAVKAGKAQPSSLALLEDRVALRQGKKQIYGSQISVDSKTGKATISPIEDEPNVNKRRASVGLQPLEDYVKQWGIDYHLPKAQ